MGRLKCYIAGPLFSAQDRSLLEEIASQLENRGVEVYLPHRDGGDLGTVIFNEERHSLRENLFREDLGRIRESDFLVALLDGQDSDSGTCVEIGIAFAAGMPIFGVKTDLERRGSVVNNMVWGACDSGKRIFTDTDSLFYEIGQFLNVKQKKREAK